MKKCNRCGEEKPLDEFGNNKTIKDGKQRMCKICTEEYNKDWNLKNPEKRRSYVYKWVDKNIDKVKERGKKWREKNKEYLYKKNYQWKKENKDKVRETRKKWENKNRESREIYYQNRKPSQRNGHLLRSYGITSELFEEYVRSQDGKCKICGVLFSSDVSTRPCIDHDHNTNEIRGILCNKCNIGIGMFGDNAFVINRAINYLIGLTSLNAIVKEK